LIISCTVLSIGSGAGQRVEESNFKE